VSSSPGGRRGTVAAVLFQVLVCALASSAIAAQRDEVELATSLFARGKIDEAEAIVRRLLREEPPDLQVVFLAGVIDIERGRYLEAADEFRLILARDPRLLRPRLELARALYLAKDYEAARYNFEQVLAAPIPDAVRQKVLWYIDQIRERVPTFAFSVDLVWDFNPNQVTSSQTVDIGGRLYFLTPSAQAEEATGLVLSAFGKLPLPQDPSWFATGYIENQDYSGGQQDQTYVQLMGGKHFNAGPHGIDLQVGGHYGAYQGSDLYSGGLARVTDFIRIRPNLFTVLSGEAAQFTYPDFSYLDGWQFTGAVEMRYALSLTQSMRAGIGFYRRVAEELPYSFTGPLGSIRYSQEWSGGWLASGLLQYGSYDYGGNDPFFGLSRFDREWRWELSIANRRLALRGMLPRVTVGAVDHQSNIPLYEFSRTYIRLGISKEF
jgi:hypothetical protein